MSRALRENDDTMGIQFKGKGMIPDFSKTFLIKGGGYYAER